MQKQKPKKSAPKKAAPKKIAKAAAGRGGSSSDPVGPGR
jgi:hypothetical protein